jgi:hypothetical protein
VSNYVGTNLAFKEFMNKYKILTLIGKFRIVAQKITYKWGTPDEWREIYSEMCCTLAKKSYALRDKSTTYIIKACKNQALNNYFKGKSVCSKPRKGLVIVSYDALSEHITTGERFEKNIRRKILIEKIFKLLNEREKKLLK